MVNKEMKFLDNGDIRYEVVDASARSNIQTINTVLDTKADTSDMLNYYTKTEVDNLISNIDGGDNSGLSNTAKNLLLTILKATVTNSDQASNIVALETELNSGGSDTPTVVNYTITNTLTNCSNSNNVSTIQENSSYTATITASSGYTLDSVTVTMGGTDITSTVYNNGAISISAVTGNIVIIANATKNVEPSASHNLLNPANTMEGYNINNYGTLMAYEERAFTIVPVIEGHKYIGLERGATYTTSGTKHYVGFVDSLTPIELTTGKKAFNIVSTVSPSCENTTNINNAAIAPEGAVGLIWNTTDKTSEWMVYDATENGILTEWEVYND